MVSVGLDVLATSDAPEDVVAGQRSATITRSRLYEISVVDIGANDEAMVLKYEGKTITMGRDGENPLPPLRQSTNNNSEMELKKLALELGLPETADEQAVMERLQTMKQAEHEVEALRKEKESLETQRIVSLVDGAIGAGKIVATSRARFMELGKLMGSQRLEEALQAVPTQRQSLLAQLNHQQNGVREEHYKSLHEVPAEELLTLRQENPQEYARLYKAEYGMEVPQEREGE
jgi:hypothetical protein